MSKKSNDRPEKVNSVEPSSLEANDRNEKGSSKDASFERERPTRIPLHEQGQVPMVEIPGYKIRLVNDVPGRIQRLQRAGWEFVSPNEFGNQYFRSQTSYEVEGDTIRMVVNTQPGARSRYGYLMKIKQEWFDEAQLAKRDRNRRIMEQINEPDAEGKLSESKLTRRQR